ncbi:MAG: BatA and WFA domain-containing protein [Crocinitomicaceae bacterium]|nr:BatA and WFA domain-containing protein [Crocinitomicaceae bacterium]
MNFVYPNFLWASLLIAVPIIIHLFNFRRYKTVYFSRVKFLKEVTEDSRSGLKLKHLLILISRILAILFLVFAFAQPYIPTADQNSTENTSLIYIDNSYSMEAEGSDGNLLNESKNQAIELVKSFDQTEKVALFTCDLLSTQYRYYSPADVIEAIKKIDFSARTTKLSTVLNSQVDMIATQQKLSNNRIFIFSDFQKSSNTLTDFKREEIQCYYYQPKGQVLENIYVDSVWFETPVHRVDAPIDVFFRIQNQSDMSQQDLSINLKIEGNQPAPKRISVEANSSAIGSINFTDKTPGIKKGSIAVSTSQLYFDDEYFFTYEIKKQVEILLVKNDVSDVKNLEQLYGLDDYYHYEATTINGLTQEKFKDKELIVLQNINKIPSGIQDMIGEALKDGCTVILIPGEEPEMSSWNLFLNSHNLPSMNQQNKPGELSYFNSDDPLYSGVFETKPSNYKFPEVSKSFSLNVQGSQNFITLFGFNSTQPFMYYGNRANGRLVFMAAPLKLAFSNFQNHALFAASFLRFAETASFQKPLAMTIGKMENFPMNTALDEKNPIHLINTEMQVDYIPLVVHSGNTRALSFAQIQDELKSSGFYELSNQTDYKDILALNYNRMESDISCYSADEIKNQFTKVGWQNAQPLQVDTAGQLEISSLKASEWWRWCLILALIFFAVEILLLKFWKS